MGKLDMSRLAKSEAIDTVGAALSFPSHGDLLIELTKLSVEAGSYMKGHTPLVVVYDPEMKEHFYKDLRKTRATLNSLGVRRATEILDNLLDAAYHDDEASLADGLRVFYAEMEIIMKDISDAIVHEDPLSVKKNLTGKPIIMVVDDTATTLRAVSSFLVDRYRLIALSDGNSALKALKTQSPDLFLIDLMMPGMSGYRLAEKIRKMEHFAQTPIIFTTGLDNDHERAAMAHGGDAFLKKPVEKEVLLEKIQSLLK